MVETDQSRPTTRPQATSEHYAARGALDHILDAPNRAVRINSTPEPMFVTIDDGEFSFWCFDYSKKCQVRENIEDVFGPFDTVVDTLHAYANDGYPIDVVDREQIDDDPKPVATSIDDFGQGEP